MTLGSSTTSSVGYLVKRLQGLLHQSMSEALRDQQLTVAQYAVLTAITEEPGLSNADLARRAFVTPQSTHRVLAELEELGLTERAPSPTHRRVLQAHVTQEGRRVLASAHAAVGEVEARMVDGLPEERVQQFRSLLERGVDNLHQDRRTRA